jgi:hypothetical protein
MKRTTIFGSAVATICLAACGSTVAPTSSPTVALTVAPTGASTPSATTTATPISTPVPSESPSSSATASPSPTEDLCAQGFCGNTASVGTNCDPVGSEGGGSIVITWTAGFGQTTPVLPATVVIDGNTVAVTGNPFIFGPLPVGDNSVILDDFTFPAGISACPTVSATCSAADSPTANLTFTGVTVGDYLNVGESTYSTLITSNPFVVNEAPAGSETWAETTSDDTIVASGTDSVATCALGT